VHDCQWFTEEIKVSTLQEIDGKMKLLSDSLNRKQDVIRLYRSELDRRMADLVIADNCVTQNFSRIHEAIASMEKQLRKDLNKYNQVNVCSLQADLDLKNFLVAKIIKQTIHAGIEGQGFRL